MILEFITNLARPTSHSIAKRLGPHLSGNMAKTRSGKSGKSGRSNWTLKNLNRGLERKAMRLDAYPRRRVSGKTNPNKANGHFQQKVTWELKRSQWRESVEDLEPQRPAPGAAMLPEAQEPAARLEPLPPSASE